MLVAEEGESDVEAARLDPANRPRSGRLQEAAQLDEAVLPRLRQINSDEEPELSVGSRLVRRAFGPFGCGGLGLSLRLGERAAEGLESLDEGYALVIVKEVEDVGHAGFRALPGRTIHGAASVREGQAHAAAVGGIVVPIDPAMRDEPVRQLGQGWQPHAEGPSELGGGALPDREGAQREKLRGRDGFAFRLHHHFSPENPAHRGQQVEDAGGIGRRFGDRFKLLTSVRASLEAQTTSRQGTRRPYATIVGQSVGGLGSGGGMVLAPEERPTPQPAATRSRVAVVKTTPGTVLDDVARAMRLAGSRETLNPEIRTGLKINVSWQVYYPGCSTTPWQLDGVIKTLTEDGHRADNLVGVHNRTVVVDSKVGEVANKHLPVVQKWGVPNVHTQDPEVEWIRYEPGFPTRVLHEIFPEGIYIPRFFIGMNMVHLPTMKTHVFTAMTGAIKNAFGGLLQERRHWTHSVIHATLADLLQIQQEIHPGIFAVMDGTIAGDGPGPRAMVPHVKNYLLASADQVAIDAVAARMMGFDPLSIEFIRLCHDSGLGCGDPRELDIVGEDISEVNFRFQEKADTFASWGQKLIYHGPLHFLEKTLLRSPIVFWAYAASRIYHDAFWYPFIGKARVARMMDSPWGRLFQSYPG